MKTWAAAILDLVCVIAFVALGIQSHGESDSLVRVAAPFVAALAIGWVIAIPLKPAESLRAGFVIWLVTLVGGMLLRRVGGDGTAFTFILVATGFLAVTMLGWRGVAALILNRKASATD
ncbi:MAG TPA: DUF3054 domain-containing protein [Actinomycetota bacterium]|nr:DUF3054 domain-containing protein [Actinomycetota bacterium]HUM86973.1 DUF3054 domain-containing protein [Actinomycetota bacterium]